MKPILTLVLFMIALTAAGSALAAVPDGTKLHASQITPLMMWVEARTGVDVPALPRVVASGTRLKTAIGLEGVRQARSMAAYLPGQVILNNVAWDPESVRGTSYLVHELVHHAQMFNNKQYPCENAKELEAYELQNQWLAEQGEPPIVSESFIKRMGSCT